MEFTINIKLENPTSDQVRQLHEHLEALHHLALESRLPNMGTTGKPQPTPGGGSRKRQSAVTHAGLRRKAYELAQNDDVVMQGFMDILRQHGVNRVAELSPEELPNVEQDLDALVQSRQRAYAAA